jgi:hypothetical protein
MAQGSKNPSPAGVLCRIRHDRSSCVNTHQYFFIDAHSAPTGQPDIYPQSIDVIQTRGKFFFVSWSTKNDRRIRSW